jgi:hypothetical protein
MAAKEMSPDARLSLLRAALQRAKTEPETLTAEPMAAVLSVSWTMLRRWVDSLKGFDVSGCYVRGGNGIPWSFKTIETVQWLITYFEQKQARTDAKRVKTAAAIGLQDDGVPTGYSIKEVGDTLNVVSRLNEQRRLAGEHVAKAEVDGMVLALISAGREAIMSVPVLADPNGALTPEMRTLIEDAAFQAAVNYADDVAALGRA